MLVTTAFSAVFVDCALGLNEIMRVVWLRIITSFLRYLVAFLLADEQAIGRRKERGKIGDRAVVAREIRLRREPPATDA